MNKDAIIISMTTWPPRQYSAVEAMQYLTMQEHDEEVHFVLTLAEDEWNKDGRNSHLPSPSTLLNAMKELGVEVLWSAENTMSHKKLMPTLQKYPTNAIIVVDDDVRQRDGWLQAFIDDHRNHPTDIIYGSSSSVVEIIDGKIFEGWFQRNMFTQPGKVTFNEKPANGVSGTLYPAGTFTDPRFFDESLYMRLSPTSDETWQWAFAVMTGKVHRCLSRCNHPFIIKSNQQCALFKTNINKYTEYHNAIAAVFPEYKDKLQNRINLKTLL